MGGRVEQMISRAAKDNTAWSWCWKLPPHSKKKKKKIIQHLLVRHGSREIEVIFKGGLLFSRKTDD
jgi:hypothetical protein